MIIRRFIPQDAEELAEIFFKSIRIGCAKDYSEEQLKVWAPEDRNLEVWKKSFEHKIVYVGENDDELTGFGELEMSGRIDRFYVHPQYHGKRVGKIIFKNLEKSAQEQGLMRIYVEASITAKPFFEKMGFTVIKEQTVQRGGLSFINYQMEKKF